MYHLFVMDYNDMAVYLTRGYCEGSKSVDATCDGICGMTVKRMGMLV
jgi:hypothetical protein